MRLNRSFMLIAALSLTLAASPAFADNLIMNGGFETGDFTGWTQSATNFLLVAQADTPNGVEATGAENGYYVFDGNYAAQLGTTDIETLVQLFPVVTGDLYRLTYWLQGDPTSSFDVFTTIFGPRPADVEVNVPLGWNENTLQFTAPISGTYALSFVFMDTNGLFLSLDDVDVEDLGLVTAGQVGTVGADTPEPSSMLLLGTGICGLAVMCRRKLFDA